MAIKQKYLGMLFCLGLLIIPCGSLFAKTPDPGGIAAGNVIINLGIAADVGYDSNVGHDTKGNEVQDGFIDATAKVRTHLNDNEQFDWNALVLFNWQERFGLGTFQGQERTPDGGFTLRASTGADLWKQSTIRLAPSISYTYLDDPEDDFMREDLKNHTINAGTHFYIQPGSGKVFSERLSYFIRPKIYAEQDTLGNIAATDLSHLYHKVESLTRWNFLPVSSLTLDVDFRIVQYLNETAQNTSSFPIRAKLGLQGLLLSRLHYNLNLGYAYSFYQDDVNEHMFIMDFSLGYSFNSNISLSVNYRKDFENSNVGNFFKYHTAGIRFNGLFIDHISTDLEFTFNYMLYRGGSSDGRIDTLYAANAGIDYVFFPGFSIGLDYKMRILNSSNTDDYMKHQVDFRISYEY